MNAQFAIDIAAIFNTDEMGVSVSYTPSGGEAVTITVITEGNDPSIMSTAAPANSWKVHVQYADVATPGKGDIITRDSVTWYLIGNLGGGKDAGEWLLEFSKSARMMV